MAIATFRLRLTKLPAAGAISPARLSQSLPAPGVVLLLLVFEGLEIRCLSSQAVGGDGGGRRLTNRWQLYLGRLCTKKCELDNGQYVGRLTLLPTLILLGTSPAVHNGWLLSTHRLLNAVHEVLRGNAVADDSGESVFHGVVDTDVLHGRTEGRLEAAFVDDEVHEEVSEIVAASATVDSNRRAQRGLQDLTASHVVTSDRVLNDMPNDVLGAGLSVHRVIDGGDHGGQRLKAVLHGAHLILSRVDLRGLCSKSLFLGFKLSGELFDGVDRGLLLVKLVLLGIELVLEPGEMRRHVEDVAVMLFQGMRNSAGQG